MVANQHLVIASLGDCRGVVCRSVEESYLHTLEGKWDVLNDDYSRSPNQAKSRKKCLWKEVSSTHTPSSEVEKSRIQEANGWITTETEIPVGQLKRMDFHDQDVIEIFQRCYHERDRNSNENSRECKAAPQRIIEIGRVCGELSVSRALGDRDFKARFNEPRIQKSSSGKAEQVWDNVFFAAPDLHSGSFQGDLVSNIPDFQSLRLGDKGVSDEFLLLACDGLWDVMDVDDAVRVTRDLLFQKKWTAKKAAARLAELAVHLGSSDNITVIVVRFFLS
jgi:serine/threonine protein phosphatase PrpC